MIQGEVGLDLGPENEITFSGSEKKKMKSRCKVR
jgi:hypothetical protein